MSLTSMPLCRCGSPLRHLPDQFIDEFAFNSVAAERLGVSETDLRCQNIIENSSGLSAGQLAVQAGVTAGAVTG